MAVQMIAAPRSVLSIVIPALNEEAAIAETVRRCLAARTRLVREAILSDVEVIVVSDGSTDQTESIALSFPEVTVLTFVANRGYGAAIKCGFEHARGDMVGFLDADGTCDPEVFGDLCRALMTENVSVALGSRMGANSEMPRLREMGNRLFAWLLGALSAQTVGDTASGMRVIRRSALPDLYPLPDGLHFTPAMSARILLENKVKLVEVPMPYAERVGHSKLSVAKDGFRFLYAIVRATLCYRPARLLMPAAAATALVGLLVALLPITFYLRCGRLEEWMIYRVLLAALLASVAMVLACTGIIADRVAAVAQGRPLAATGGLARLRQAFGRQVVLLAITAALAISVLVVWPGVVEYWTTRHVAMHWSRAVFSTLILGLLTTYATTAFLLDLLDLIRFQRTAATMVQAPDRVRSGKGSDR